jgi:hypothetical protein
MLRVIETGVRNPHPPRRIRCVVEQRKPRLAVTESPGATASQSTVAIAIRKLFADGARLLQCHGAGSERVIASSSPPSARQAACRASPNFGDRRAYDTSGSLQHALADNMEKWLLTRLKWSRSRIA